MCVCEGSWIDICLRSTRSNYESPKLTEEHNTIRNNSRCSVVGTGVAPSGDFNYRFNYKMIIILITIIMQLLENDIKRILMCSPSSR